jgi:glutathione S-transferase
MMKLYYSPGACSQAAHIVLHETGFSHDSVRVDLDAKKNEDSSDYWRINPKGAVPSLELENGEVLTENAVILQYLGDRPGSPELLPPLGDFRRYRVLEWLNFVATELHKGMSPLYNAKANDEYKEVLKERLRGRFAILATQLEKTPFVLGDTFTVADPYAYYVLRAWQKMGKTDLSDTPSLRQFYARMGERPSVKAVLEAEKLAP